MSQLIYPKKYIVLVRDNDYREKKQIVWKEKKRKTELSTTLEKNLHE